MPEYKLVVARELGDYGLAYLVTPESKESTPDISEAYRWPMSEVDKAYEIGLELLFDLVIVTRE